MEPEQLADMHPAHAAYVYAQNQVAIFSEQLTALPEIAPLADMVSRAENLYLPSGPPMSSLTRSYFTCCALFDACLYPPAETIGTTIVAVAEALGVNRGSGASSSSCRHRRWASMSRREGNGASSSCGSW